MLLTLALVGNLSAWAQQYRSWDDSTFTRRNDIHRSTKRMGVEAVLYAVADGGPADSQIFAILGDGTLQTIGPVHPSFDIEAIDVSPITGELYAISGEDGDQDGKLWHVDKVNGALTFIGETGAVGANEIMSASFDPSGVLWAFQQHVGLVTVDLVTAQLTLQWTPPAGIGKNWEGLGWDNTGTYLYGSEITTLYRWNPVTQTAEVLCGGANFLPNEVEALDVRPDGVLFAGHSELDPADMRIFRVDPDACTVQPSGYNTGQYFDIETLAFERPTPPCTGLIADFVWDDRNNDGLQDPGEPGLANVTVLLQTLGGNPITSSVTNSSGMYLFSGLCAGDYRLEIDPTTLPPGGYVASPCNTGSNDEMDNDCSGATCNLPTDASEDRFMDFGFTCGCTDTNACTDDTCDQTLGCLHTPIVCNDLNVCTDDSCDAEKGCVYAPANIDDGNACTVDTCDAATGEHHDAVVCDDGNACTNDTCDSASGCVYTPISCDDGNACTNDSCDAASGCVRTIIDCSDGNKCTNDSCDAASGCVNTTIDCSDGNACTNDSCDSASGCVRTTIDCNDGNKCTNDSCDRASGCVNTTIDCSDGNACTTDSCDSASGCVRTTIDCNDHNKCTNDSCNPASGCVNTAVNCDDGNSCTNDSCDPASGCVRTTIDCNDQNPCTNDRCNPASGCSFTPIDCSDSNACTTDSCDPASGCGHAPVACDDGNSCTNDRCDPATGCVNTPVSCDDSNPCTDDTCHPTQGCLNTAKGCNDGNACTTDSCHPTTGACVNAPIDCNDQDTCTDDSCNPASGCVNTPRTPCGGTDVCIPRNGGTIPGGTIEVTEDPNGDVTVLFIQTVDVNDNSYGTNIVNWPRSHSFSALTGSDRAQFVFTNANGNVVFDFSVDYISQRSGVPSGYASLGLAGGDGRLTTGQGSWLLDWETSLEKNLNDTGYCTGGNCTVSGVNLLVNSPPTNPPNTSYNVPPAFNQWIYPITYKVKISHLAFGSSGFGSVTIPYVHNSPPKVGDNATPYVPCPCPTPCNDNNPCTDDTCNMTGQCVYTPKTCNDGNRCTSDSCNPATGACTYTPITCNDNNACTNDSCQPSRGCVNTPKTCNDSNKCTTDSCNSATGACTYAPVSCDDHEPCTVDSCTPSKGCVHKSIRGCGDGDDHLDDDHEDDSKGGYRLR